MRLLELEDVRKQVRTAEDEPLDILTGVDFTVDEGERVSIVGRSGSGKSTLLNILGLLDSHTGGQMRFLETPIERLSSGRRDRLRGGSIGFVFQQFNLLPRRTAVENVAMPLLYEPGARFWRRERLAAEMLERVGLGHRLDSTPDRLSGGEQQRVAIARALVRTPRLILADEPTGALDLETGQTVMQLLEEVVEGEGAALITITHDVSIAARADRRLRLEGGRLVAEGAGGETVAPAIEAGAALTRGVASSGAADTAEPGRENESSTERVTQSEPVTESASEPVTATESESESAIESEFATVPATRSDADTEESACDS